MNNNNTASQFMDKQIMDLSMSQSTTLLNNNDNNNNSNSGSDFINFSPENQSYNFFPTRPSGESTAAPAIRSSNFDSGDDESPLRSRMRNSLDSKANASSIRNYSSLEVDDPAKFTVGNNRTPANASLDVSLISEVDRTMKKYMDNLANALEGVSSRLSQVETRTRNLENLVDDLKVLTGNNHGSTDGKLRQLENIIREVQTDVHAIKDKQEIVNAQMQISKLQISKVEQVENQNSAYTESTQLGVPTHQQSSNASLTQPPPTLPPSNPPPPPYTHNFQPQVQLPNQFPQNQAPSVPQRESNFPQPGQTPENPGQSYQMPPSHQPQPQPQPQPQHQPQHQHQHQHPPPPPPQPQVPPQQNPLPPPQLQAPPQQHPPPPPPQHQYQMPHQPHYSHPPPPSQALSSSPFVNPSIPQPHMGHHPEETPYAPSQSYPPTVRPSLSHPSTGVPSSPSQQFYGPPSSLYDSPSGRPGPGYPGPFGPASGPGEPYPYSSSLSQYGSGSPMKKQSPVMDQSGRSGYSQLPTARILPQAAPKASGVSGGSGSSSSGNKVSIDDVVDKVTSMGFPRDQAMATVRRLTENGQAVDLNVVLDKIMNDGDAQGPRGWFGR